MQENGIDSFDELSTRADASVSRFNALGDSIKSAEARLQEIAVLKTHIINYSKTRDVYVAYRKSGYSRKFFEEHRESITIHKAAKDAFNKLGLKKLPRVKELSAEYAEVLAKRRLRILSIAKPVSRCRNYSLPKRSQPWFWKRSKRFRKGKSDSTRKSRSKNTDNRHALQPSYCRWL